MSCSKKLAPSRFFFPAAAAEALRRESSCPFVEVSVSITRKKEREKENARHRRRPSRLKQSLEVAAPSATEDQLEEEELPEDRSERRRKDLSEEGERRLKVQKEVAERRRKGCTFPLLPP